MKEKSIYINSNISKQNLEKFYKLINELSVNGFISLNSTIQFDENEEEKVREIINKHFPELDWTLPQIKIDK